MSNGQSKRQSFIEAVANTIVGYGVAVSTQVIVFPMFGLHTTLTTNMKMGLIFTLVSLARSYILRRIFNKEQEK